MAKKAAKATGRGGGTREDQIKRLRQSIGAKGEAEAKKIIEMYDADVIRYAAKTDNRKKPATSGGLGSRLEALLAAISDPAERERTRETLTAAKREAAKK